jgi:DNA-binding GntR family transcriptional regulator
MVQNTLSDAGAMRDLDALGDSLTVVRSAPTLRVQALEKLRKAIIGGDLAPGARLVERKLCDVLNVSRTVVREILRQLEAEGWVVNPPYKGPTVATVSADEMRQIYEIRGALEGLAARLCATRARDDHIKRLEDAVSAMARAASEGNVERHIHEIESFYEALTEGAGHAIMQAYLASHRSRVARLRSMSLSRPQRAEKSVVEKRKLVEAIKARDSATAQRLAEEHVRNSQEAALTAPQADEQKDAEQKSGEVAPRSGKRRAVKKPSTEPSPRSRGGRVVSRATG